MESNKRKKLAFVFLVFLGFISLLSDFTHEGARSIYGTYLGLIGVSAFLISFIAGLGEFVGQALRVVTGIITDKTKRYWLMMIVGYAMNLLAIPLLMFVDANIWQVALVLIVLSIAAIFGFLPLAMGIAIMGPVLSVGIKRFTTSEGAAMGFALFYTLMNVGWALGGYLFDHVRGAYGEHSFMEFPLLGIPVSTYQVIFIVSFLLSIPNLLLILSMRDRVRMTDTHGVVIDPEGEKQDGNWFVVGYKSIAKAAADTGRIFGTALREKAFWLFLFMLGILVPVRLVFYHFHYTFPKYGIRVLGEGVKIGNIYGVLNPMLIVFLVPLVGYLTKKVSSYKMMIIGTTISASAVFLATIPTHVFQPLMDTWFATIVFDRWLDVPAATRSPVFLILIVFIAVFTVGEAIWSPRMMQFTAEIAPVGREGSYIALSYLPFFLAKMIAGPMSGWLVQTYTPEGALSYPHHYWVWIWIGGMAALSPLGLILFNNLFRSAEQERHEEKRRLEEKLAAEEAAKTGATS